MDGGTTKSNIVKLLSENGHGEFSAQSLNNYIKRFIDDTKGPTKTANIR